MHARRTVLALAALRCSMLCVGAASAFRVAAEGEEQRENGHLRCPLGKYRLPSSDVCERCPAGKFASALTRIMVSSHDVCMHCPAGRMSDAPRVACVTTCATLISAEAAGAGAGAGVGSAPAYQHRVTRHGRHGAAASCEYCPAGQYARRERLPWERPAAAATAAAAAERRARRPCIQCAWGRFMPTAGAGPRGCKACPVGKQAHRNGATHCDDLFSGTAVGAGVPGVPGAHGAGAGAAEGGHSLGSAGSWLAAHQVAAYCFAAVLLAFVASLAYAVCLPGPGLGAGPGSAAADIELQRELGGVTATAGEGRGLLPAPASSAGAQLGVDRPI